MIDLHGFRQGHNTRSSAGSQRSAEAGTVGHIHRGYTQSREPVDLCHPCSDLIQIVAAQQPQRGRIGLRCKSRYGHLNKFG